MELPYICKFCKSPMMVKLGPDESLQNLVDLGFTVEKWTSKLACNRCADFHNTRCNLRDSIMKACFWIQTIRSSNKASQELMEKARIKLTDLTKRFAALVCNHNHKPLLWEPDFVEMLLERPEIVNTILNKYHKMAISTEAPKSDPQQDVFETSPPLPYKDE